MAVKTKAVQAPVMPATAEEKKKALETALDQIEKRFGKGAVMKLGQAAAMNVDAIPTGSIGLDLALGSAACQRDELLRFLVRNPPVRPQSHSRSLRRRKSGRRSGVY